MKNDFTKKQKVLGLLVVGNREFYVLGWKKLSDEVGKELEGIGWLVTSTRPLNAEMLLDEEVIPVYNPTSLAIGGCVLFDLPELPQEIDLFNVNYDDDEGDEISEDDLMNLPDKMSEDEWNELLTKWDNKKIKEN